MKQRNRLVLGSFVILILMAGLAQLQAQMTNVTIHNSTSSYLTLYDRTTGATPDALVPRDGAVTTYSLNTNDTYTLEHYFYQNAGHPFSFSGGQVLPGGTTPTTSQFFQVAGNDIYVSGVKVTFKRLSGTPTFVYGDGSFAAPFGFPQVGGPDYVVDLIPADTNFLGTYHFIFTTANSATIQLGTNIGVASIVSDVPGDGTSYVANGPYSILATLSNGDMFEITAIPEPSALALSLLAALGGLAFRLKRAR